MSEFSSPAILTDRHDVSRFDCGKPPLNDFLTIHALAKQNAMLSRTYVVASGEMVAGYYTLAHIAVTQSETPKKIGRGMPSTIPALLMARFAVDSKFQGKGLGRSMFTDALRRCWAVMADGPAPVRIFVVDAKDAEAKTFYERFDAIASPTMPMRLFLSHKDLRLIFEAQAEERL
ncbi:MAG: GNAT family N-acetyltransferase [Armatimonadetes bacterium]|nr:GNAT family N-acetyltransferase [Armatimonadota bacterium]